MYVSLAVLQLLLVQAKEKRKNYAGSEKSLLTLIKKGAPLKPGTVELLHQRTRKRSMGIRRFAYLT